MWIDFIHDRLGNQAVDEYYAMLSGELIVPPIDIFGEDYKTVEYEIEINGTRQKSYKWEIRK